MIDTAWADQAHALLTQSTNVLWPLLRSYMTNRAAMTAGERIVFGDTLADHLDPAPIKTLLAGERVGDNGMASGIPHTLLLFVEKLASCRAGIRSRACPEGISSTGGSWPYDL